jgi:hypothetical protein
MNTQYSLFLIIPGAIIGGVAIISGAYFTIQWVCLTRKLNELIKLVNNKLIIIREMSKYDVRMAEYEFRILDLYRGRDIHRLKKGIEKAKKCSEKFEDYIREPDKHFQELRS